MCSCFQRRCLRPSSPATSALSPPPASLSRSEAVLAEPAVSFNDAAASFDDDTVAWFENDGAGGFGAARVITTAADGASSVFAADLDGDGDPDALTAAAFADTVAWHPNLIAPAPAVLGASCAGLTLAANRMRLGAAWTVQLANIDPVAQIGLFFLGASSLEPGLQLSPSCRLYVFPNLPGSLQPVVGGVSTYGLAVPSATSLLGAQVVIQGFAHSLDPAAWDRGGVYRVAVSNGLRGTVGY